MGNIDLSILNDLTAFDSATVQNAAIRIRGFINESDDYTGTSLKRYTGEMPTVVGIATTVKAKALHKPTENEGTVPWKEYYEKISTIELPFISIFEDIDSPRNRAALFGDNMAFMHSCLGAVGVVACGAIRDVPGIQRSGISVWAEGRVPGHGPFNAVSLVEQVNIDGLNVNEEDVLVADADGITKIENEILKDIIKACEEVRKDEARTQKFFSVKDKTRYKTWTAQDYT